MHAVNTWTKPERIALTNRNLSCKAVCNEQLGNLPHQNCICNKGAVKLKAPTEEQAGSNEQCRMQPTQADT